LPDSYTSFKNKIGLTVDDGFLSEKKEIVLSWPYKDCVLEGGMTKELKNLISFQNMKLRDLPKIERPSLLSSETCFYYWREEIIISWKYNLTYLQKFNKMTI